MFIYLAFALGSIKLKVDAEVIANLLPTAGKILPLPVESKMNRLYEKPGDTSTSLTIWVLPGLATSGVVTIGFCVEQLFIL